VPHDPTVDDETAAVSRALEHRDRDGRPARVATISRRYDTTVDDLWEACTSPERLPRWFAPVTGDLELGGRYQVEGNAGGTIESCDPPRSFGATWEYGGEVSWIAVRLEPDGDGARLSLEHTAPADAMPEFWERYGPGATGVGWDLALFGLGRHLSTGADRPAETAGFEATDDGRRLITAASAAWAEAGVAAGEDRGWAEAARDRTTAFYLGEPEPDLDT
jgi:uncharacterized protein YndB with AHSA1/START domain